MTEAIAPDPRLQCATASHSSVVKVLVSNSSAVTHLCIAAPFAGHPLRLSQVLRPVKRVFTRHPRSQCSFTNRLRLWGSGRFLMLKRIAFGVRHSIMKTGSEGTTRSVSASRWLAQQRFARSGKDEYATTARGCQRFVRPIFGFWRNFAGRYCFRSYSVNCRVALPFSLTSPPCLRSQPRRRAATIASTINAGPKATSDR